jgi:two-component system LytT family response regulator
MKTYKALIVDDEPAARENLKDLLHSYCPQVKVTGMAANATEARELMAHATFDILLLDINLGTETGFDLLQPLSSPYPFHVIFVTAYDEYAIKAFKYAAKDYLLKPINKHELLQAIEKIDAAEKAGQPLNGFAETADNTLKPDNKKFLLPTKDGWEVVQAGRILYLNAEGSYTTLYLDNGKVLHASKNLKHYQSLLSNLPFLLRVHKSYIVNTCFITRIIKSDGGSIVMTNGTTIPLSPEIKDLVYNLYKE